MRNIIIWELSKGRGKFNKVDGEGVIEEVGRKLGINRVVKVKG